MSAFTLLLRDYQHQQRFEDTLSFVGEDASGSFGIQAQHVRMMTSLVFGLARFRCQAGSWTYIALPGGLAYFRDNTLSIITRRYFLDTDYDRISHTLTEELLAEETKLSAIKQSLRHMEEDLLKQMWLLRREIGTI
ncbi:MAG: F0F1 ATP synthase subunit epsilon [Gammaproteobacteria bacterium]|jgi:F-type H+-transporting ATPase subunit epsilon